jgi:hypothetical protein
MERLLYVGMTLAIVGATLKWQSTALLVSGGILVVFGLFVVWSRMEGEE